MLAKFGGDNVFQGRIIEVHIGTLAADQAGAEEHPLLAALGALVLVAGASLGQPAQGQALGAADVGAIGVDAAGALRVEEGAGARRVRRAARSFLPLK